MAELCDIWDAAGKPTGKILPRGTHLPAGEYFLAVHVWLRDENGNYLIQQRAHHLKSGGGMWATTAGYVVAGEASQDGAIREVSEELGLAIRAEQLRYFERATTEYRLEDVWLVDVVQADLGTPILEADVADWGWHAKPAIEAMIQAGTFVPYTYFDRLP